MIKQGKRAYRNDRAGASHSVACGVGRAYARVPYRVVANRLQESLETCLAGSYEVFSKVITKPMPLWQHGAYACWQGKNLSELGDCRVARGEGHSRREGSDALGCKHRVRYVLWAVSEPRAQILRNACV